MTQDAVNTATIDAEGQYARSPEAVILTRLDQTAPLSFDELAARVPQLTWNQVFQAVDGLARSGVIHLRRNRFQYELLKTG